LLIEKNSSRPNDEIKRRRAGDQLPPFFNVLNVSIS
jgi:hypothetical protein